MSTLARSFSLRRGRASVRHTRRTTRLAPRCESLENRQLLSIGQPGLASGVLASPLFANPHLFSPVAVSNFVAPSSFNIEIQFGSFGGQTQIEVFFFGGGTLFSPTPASSPGGGGAVSSLGTLGGSSGGSGNVSGSGSSSTGVGLVTASTSNPSITPLNPSAASATNTPSAPVYVVPPPVALPAVHLGSSAAPATAQSNSTMISNLDEQPPVTRFGQGDIFDSRQLFTEKHDVKPQSSSLIDYIEPFRAIVPASAPAAEPAPQGQPAPAPDAAKTPLVPAISDPSVDAALDLTDGRVLTRSRDGEAAQAGDQVENANTSWSLSAIFGAAVVAAGGYNLVLRDKDRVRGRSIPRWLGAERPTKPKTGSPSR